MAAVVLIVAGALAALLARPGLAALARAGWTRENYRGRALPLPAGALAVVAAMLALGPLALLQEWAGVDVLRGTAAGAGVPLGDDVVRVLALPLGVALLGLLDDLLDAEPRGWRGHGAAVLRGGFSTGALKAAGTLALALAVLAGLGLAAGEYLLATAVLVLATNLFNLLDLRPGRAAKAFVLLGAGLLASSWDDGPLRTVALFGGPLLVLGAYDLRERAMLGDTGSNVLGALAGLWLVCALGTAGQLVALGVLLALTAYGELASISRAIERVAPLRWLDGLGRLREPAAPGASAARQPSQHAGGS